MEARVRRVGERVVRSVANLTRHDGEEFFQIVRDRPIRTAVEVFPLSDAEVALDIDEQAENLRLYRDIQC